MAELTPAGHVVEGKYKGKEVYVWKENISLMIHNGLLKSGTLFGSPESCRLYEINTSSIVDYQEMGSVTQNANTDAVLNIGFWFGSLAAATASQIGKQEIHTVAVEYPNGERSLLEINSYAYRTFKSIAFAIDEQKRKKQAYVLPNNSSEHKNIPTYAQSSRDTMKRQVIINTDNLDASIRRANLFLEDGKFDTANEYFESILDIEPENAEAYLGKLMAELKVRTRKQLADCSEPFDDSDNYKKVLRFGDETLVKEMSGYITHINERNENTRLSTIYYKTKNAMITANSEEDFKKLSQAFETISGFKDANNLAQQCLDKAEVCRKDAIYSRAFEVLDDRHKWQGKNTGIKALEGAIAQFQTISGWKDADEQIYACQKKIEEIKAKEEADRLEAERKTEEKRIAKENRKKKVKKTFVIGIPILCVIIAFIIVLATVIIPTAKYNKAIEKYGQEWVDTVMNASVGDTIVFGTYEQDNNISNGKEAIEWTVLDKNGISLLLISKQALDCQQYNTKDTDVTWENCTLRKWINDTFLNDAFNVEEQAQIQNTSVSADINSQFSTNPGNTTTDKIFLLSSLETEKYFSTEESRKCVPTAYAKAQGAYTSDSNKTESSEDTCFWWLRSPGSYQNYVTYVPNDGSIYQYGYCVNNDDCSVRPAMWINLDS